MREKRKMAALVYSAETRVYDLTDCRMLSKLPTESPRRPFIFPCSCHIPVLRIDRKFAPSLSLRQDARPSSFGCVGGSCWAGVYVDSISNDILHLEKGGRAFFSPGTAASSREDGFWWKAEGDRLRIFDSSGQPLTWAGTGSDLRRDPLQAGKMAGFGVEVERSRGAKLVKNSQLVRDSLGFMFPGCTYVLSSRSGSATMADSHESRVVVNQDGTVTDIVMGTRIARWAFPEAKPLSDGDDESWPTGDEILLVLESDCNHVGATVCVSYHRTFPL